VLYYLDPKGHGIVATGNTRAYQQGPMVEYDCSSEKGACSGAVWLRDGEEKNIVMRIVGFHCARNTATKTNCFYPIDAALLQRLKGVERWLN